MTSRYQEVKITTTFAQNKHIIRACIS